MEARNPSTIRLGGAIVWWVPGQIESLAYRFAAGHRQHSDPEARWEKLCCSHELTESARFPSTLDGKWTDCCIRWQIEVECLAQVVNCCTCWLCSGLAIHAVLADRRAGNHALTGFGVWPDCVANVFVKSRDRVA